MNINFKINKFHPKNKLKNFPENNATQPLQWILCEGRLAKIFLEFFFFKNLSPGGGKKRQNYAKENY